MQTHSFLKAEGGMAMPQPFPKSFSGCGGTIAQVYTHTAVRWSNELLFRLRRPVITYERHTSALRVSVGDIGRQVLRSCRSTVLRPCCRRSGERLHQRRADVVQSEREVTVSAQSQVSSTVSTVFQRTGQLWAVTCPQCHRWPER